MGICIEKIKHVGCTNGSKKALQVFANENGSVDGFCFSCGQFVSDPYGDGRNASQLPKPKIKSSEELQAELAEIENYQYLPLNNKKLSADALQEFGIRVGVSEQDGVTPETVYYPYFRDGKLRGYKVKLLPKAGSTKRMWSVGDLKSIDFFGWQQALNGGNKRIIIVEGEDDVVALTRILKRYGKEEYGYPGVISLPHGASSALRDVEKVRVDLQRLFKEVVLCFDNDEAGKQATDAVLRILPTAIVATLPSKDANQCLIDGYSKAAFNAVMFSASVPKNTRLVFSETLHEAARHQALYGELSWPWKKINEKTRGIRYGETIYIGAGVKMGKSDLVNALAAHFIKEHGIKVFMAKPEESNNKTYKLLAGKIVGRNFNDPDITFDSDAYDRAGEILRDRVALVNLYQHLGWTSLKSDIISAIGWGAKAIFIDPITNLTNGENAGEANSKLQEIAQDLAAMALDNQVVIFIFCHLKEPQDNISRDKREKMYRDGKYIGLGNCPHELGGDISSAQFAGSRAMMRSCNMMLGLEGNKDAELEDQIRNIRHLVLLEDREFGETGRFGLYWNKETTLFKEIEV